MTTPVGSRGAERALRQLFDYQKFARNEKLSAVIEESGTRLSGEIPDDDLGELFAAGDGGFPAFTKEKDDVP